MHCNWQPGNLFVTQRLSFRGTLPPVLNHQIVAFGSVSNIEKSRYLGNARHKTQPSSFLTWVCTITLIVSLDQFLAICGRRSTPIWEMTTLVQRTHSAPGVWFTEWRRWPSLPLLLLQKWVKSRGIDGRLFTRSPQRTNKRLCWSMIASCFHPSRPFTHRSRFHSPCKLV